jgi:hydrogenase-4 membrane subunit HyfE
VVTNSMEQSWSWKSISHSAGQYCPVWNPNIHCCVHKNPPLDHNPSQFSPVYSLTLCFVIRFVSILSFHLCPCVPNCLFLWGIPTKMLLALLISSMHVACPAQCEYVRERKICIHLFFFLLTFKLLFHFSFSRTQLIRFLFPSSVNIYLSLRSPVFFLFILSAWFISQSTLWHFNNWGH